MLIDLGRIIHYDEAELPVDLDLTIEANELGDIVQKVEKPFHIKGQIRNVRDLLTFGGKITGRFLVLCSRCNSEVWVDFECGFDETILKQADDAMSDGILVENDAIDIKDAMISNIIVNLPIRYLCDKNCKGLCPSCGANLNIENCNCVHTQADERLLVLQKLLDQDKL